MKKLSVKLEHGYGVNSLEAEFDFASHRVYALYVPNGVMKSSFAKTFRDLSEGVPSSDRIFTGRVCTREIKDGTGTRSTGL